MCILKQAEPKGRGSVIRPMKQMLVEGVGQTGRREGALAGGPGIAEGGGGSRPQPRTDSGCDSEQVEAACFSSPHLFV